MVRGLAIRSGVTFWGAQLQKRTRRAVCAGGAVVADGRPARAGSRRLALVPARAPAASAAALPLLLTACKGIQALGTPPPPPADVARCSPRSRPRRPWSPGMPRPSAARGRLAADGRAQDVAAYASARVRPDRARRAPGAAEVAAGRAARGLALSASPAPNRRSPAATGATARAAAGRTRAAEQAASDRLIAQLGGLPPSLAQLFASIAASEATHVPYLRAARRGR